MKDPMTRLEVASTAAMTCRRDAIDTVLDRIYERHVANVDHWVRRLTGPREDVEDLVHEVFLIAGYRGALRLVDVMRLIGHWLVDAIR